MSSVSRFALVPGRNAALVQRRRRAPRPGSPPARREGFAGVTASFPRVHRELNAQHAALIG